MVVVTHNKLKSIVREGHSQDSQSCLIVGEFKLSVKVMEETASQSCLTAGQVSVKDTRW